MDDKFRAEWVAALRSGQYEQCRDELHDGFGYCCIGVGYQVKGNDSEEIMEEDDPTEIAADAIGIPRDIRIILIRMNDGAPNEPPKSFAEIADYIEGVAIPRPNGETHD